MLSKETDLRFPNFFIFFILFVFYAGAEYICSNKRTYMKQKVEKETETIQEQIKKALDGRTQRWLSFKAEIAESELSRKINAVLKSTIVLADPKIND